jgi:hypothetical protein
MQIWRTLTQGGNRFEADPKGVGLLIVTKIVGSTLGKSSWRDGSNPGLVVSMNSLLGCMRTVIFAFGCGLAALPAPLLAQVSPLSPVATPLAAPDAVSSAVVSGSPVSVLLVGAVLLGILLVIALVIRRQR